MQTLPADILNRAIDQLPGAEIIGALTDGTKESEAGRRVYGPTLRQLLRAVHWTFARKMAPLDLLGDATGNTIDLATGQPISAEVEPPWAYAYAWPNDGVNARWMPWNGGGSGQPPALPSQPGTLVNGPPYQIPARFLVSSSDQFPAVVGQTDWDDLPDISGSEGMGYIDRRIVLSDAPQAQFVYTKLTLQIEEWDELFAEAMVAILASRLAIPLIPDKKMAMTIRSQQVMIAKDAVSQARVANANDAGFPQTIDHTPNWIAGRSGAGRGGWDCGGPGVLFNGWSSMSFADGSVF